jgi:hypothetical protein
MKKDKVYALRCFIDGKRIKSHELTKRQARVFQRTAKHLLEYLTKEYKLNE